MFGCTTRGCPLSVFWNCRPKEYASIISFISHSLTDSPAALFALLHERITSLAAAQRFEEAAEMRDRTQALVLAINRQRGCDQLRAAGSVSVRAGDIHYDFESGVLVNTRREDQLFSPITSRNSKVIQGIFDFLHPHQPEALES